MAVPRQNTDRLSNQVYRLDIKFGLFTCKTGHMLRLLRLLVVFFTRLFRSRRDLLLENLALRQQLGVLKQKHPPPRFATCASPKFHPTEKLNRSPDVLTVKSWLPPHSCKLKSDENTGGRNFGEGQVQVQSLNLRSRQAYDGGKIHHSHQIWPARAGGKEVSKLQGKEPRRTGITLLDGLLIPASGRIDVRKNRVITKKATRNSKRRAVAKLFEQGLCATLFSDALMHSSEPADHRRIPEIG